MINMYHLYLFWCNFMVIQPNNDYLLIHKVLCIECIFLVVYYSLHNIELMKRMNY